jgi:putative FmdB family regulatory protein
MPIYVLECQKCEHQWDAFFSSDEKKKEGKCPACGKKGKRIFTAPNVAIDTKINPTDLDGLTRKTGQMKGNIGDLWDIAREASEKRGGKNDPIKKKALANYAKKRGGKKYREDKSVDFEFRVNGKKVD